MNLRKLDQDYALLNDLNYIKQMAPGLVDTKLFHRRNGNVATFWEVMSHVCVLLLYLLGFNISICTSMTLATNL
jgi:hypothetical protein